MAFLPSAVRVTREFESYLNKSLDLVNIVSDVDPARLFFLRPSAFPYCGLRSFLEFPKRLEHPRIAGLPSAYFTSVGTTVHSVFQAYTAPLGRMVGDWKCNKCGTVTKFTTFKTCECGGHPEYLELDLKYKKRVVGHSDALYRFSPPAGKKSRHAVIDYKTTSTAKVKEDKEQAEKGRKRVFPYRSNVAQIEMYIPLIEAQYGIEVDYWILVYLARDAPFKYGRRVITVHVTEKRKAFLRKKLDRWVKLHKKVLNAKTLEDTEVIKKYKLCKSLEDYHLNHEDEHNPCPYVDVCFKSKALNATIKDTMTKHKVFPLIKQAPEWIQKELT